MKNLFISPDSFYLADTKVLYTEGPSLHPRIYVRTERKNVGVVQIFGNFYELEKLTGFHSQKLLTCEGGREYMDTTTLRKFSYEKGFDYRNANLQKLRGAYRTYVMTQLDSNQIYSLFSIDKLYTGDIRQYKVLTPHYINTEISEKQVYLLHFENNSFMKLSDFLKGKNTYLFSQVDFSRYIDFSSLKELPLEEILVSGLEKGLQKHLQFPKSNI